MTTPRVSIVTTVYDRTDCLARCLRAMQHSAYTDFEQIVVSDAPPAAVVVEIARLCATVGPNVRHFNLATRTNNWGIGPAEVGLRAAVGEFVCFLSDDNAYLPDHLGRLVTALDAEPDLGFVYSSCLYGGHRELRVDPPRGAQIDLGQPLFRRSALGEALPFMEEFAWDWRLIESLMARGVRWRHIDELSFVFRLAAYPTIMEALA